MSTRGADLDNLLASHDPEEQAEILRVLIDEHRSPDDPLYALLRLFKLTIEINSQTISVSEQIPMQLASVLNEIDEKFDYRVSQWRGLPPDIVAMFRDAIMSIIPEIQAQAKAAAASEIAAERDAVASHRAEAIEGHRADLQKAASDTMTMVARETAKSVRNVDPKRVELWARFNTLLFGIVVFVGGVFAGGGWVETHISYPAPIAKLIEYGEAYQTMYPHMPTEMKSWIQQWMARSQ